MFVKVSATFASHAKLFGSKICSGKFVDFALLRPCNLKKLPTTEPSTFQITKMLRSDLAQVRSFVDWAEAWAVYTGVLSSHDPSKVKNLIGYFLLLSTASREVPGLGWLEYDKAFRKLAEDDPTANWGEASPTLWVTTVITKGSVQGIKDSSVFQQGTKEILYCHRWNNGFCPNNAKCRYVHQCSACKGKHPKLYCPSSQAGVSQPDHQQQKERAGSPPPKKKYKQ